MGEHVIPQLKNELDESKNNMSDPRTIRDKAKQIKEFKNQLKLLKDFTYLVEENDNNVQEAKKIMCESIDDLKRDTLNNPNREKILTQANRDEKIINSIEKYARTVNVDRPSDRQNTEDVVQTDFSFLDDVD